MDVDDDHSGEKSTDDSDTGDGPWRLPDVHEVYWTADNEELFYIVRTSFLSIQTASCVLHLQQGDTPYSDGAEYNSALVFSSSPSNLGFNPGKAVLPAAATQPVCTAVFWYLLLTQIVSTLIAAGVA